MFIFKLTAVKFLIIFAVISFLIFVSVIITALFEKKKSAGCRIIRMILSVLFGLSVCITSVFGIPVAKAFRHGMTKTPIEISENNYDYKYDLTLEQIINYNNYTKPVNKLKNLSDAENKIIIFVRYDCRDCHLLYDSMPDAEDVIYISSRSDTGHKLMEKYNIDLVEVPSVVYISKSGTVHISSLCEGTGDDMHFNTAGWNKIVERYEKDN